MICVKCGGGYLAKATSRSGVVCSAYSKDRAIAMRDCYIELLGCE